MTTASIKSQILKYGAVSLAVAITVVVATFFVNDYISKSQEIKVEAKKLAISAKSQSSQILPGLLVAEEYGSIALQLKMFTTSENLESAEFIENGNNRLAKILSCPTVNDTKICTSYLKNLITTVTEVGLPGETLGYLVKTKRMSKNTYQDSGLLWSLSAMIGTLTLIFLGLISAILVFIDRQLRLPLLNLQNLIGPAIEKNVEVSLGQFKVEEVHIVAKHVTELIKRYQEKRAAAAQVEIASQVAHDIRSPLTLLGVVAKQAVGLSDEQRNLLQMATDRINKIASDLLVKYRTEKNPQSAVKNYHLPSALEKIVIEKRINIPDATIGLRVDKNALDLFAGFDHSEFGRALSNLIQNGIEACEQGQKRVEVCLRRLNSSELLLEIIDFGKGIPEEFLSKIGERGQTSGKANGNGLGVFQAKSFAEKSGGTFSIESKVGVGTKICLKLPSTP